MVTLFILPPEIWYGFILFTLLGLYGLSKWMLFRYDTISEKARRMTDSELLDYFSDLVKEQVEKPSLRKSQELNELWEVCQKRELIKKMSNEELMIYCKSISALDEAFSHSKWYKRLADVQYEMEKRHLH